MTKNPLLTTNGRLLSNRELDTQAEILEERIIKSIRVSGMNDFVLPVTEEQKAYLLGIEEVNEED